MKRVNVPEGRSGLIPAVVIPDGKAVAAQASCVITKACGKATLR